MIILYIVLGTVVGVPVYLLIAKVAQGLIMLLAGITSWLGGFHYKPFDKENFLHEIDGKEGSFIADVPCSIRIIFFWLWIALLLMLVVGFGTYRVLRAIVIGWIKLIRAIWIYGE